MNGFSSSTIPARTWLFLILLLYVALWLIYPQEFIASDPSAYSTRAFAISKNFDFGDSDIFNHRLGITVPVALIYSIAGVSIITTNLWPLLAALLVIVTVWLALPDDKSKIIGALLCLTSIPLFNSSIALFPDIVATAFMSSSSLILFKRRELAQSCKTSLLAPLTAIVLLFIAFLAKESAYWALPLWAIALSADLKSEDRSTLLRQFYIPALIAGIFLGATYLIFCQTTWGDALARIHSIQAHTGQHLWSWDKGPTSKLLGRLTTAPVNLLLNQYGAITLLLAALGIVIAPKSIKPWSYYAISCLLLFWFGSTSLTRYEPMPLFDRMTLPLLPALYVLAALTLSRISLTAERATSINSFVPILLALAFAGAPFAQYVKAWEGAEVTEAVAMSIVKNDIKRHPDKEYLLVCSDTRNPEILSFYFGYQYPKNLHVVFAGNLTEELLKKEVRLVYIDRQRSTFLKSAYGRPNYDNEIDALGLSTVYKSGNVELLIENRQDALRKLIPVAETTNVPTK